MKLLVFDANLTQLTLASFGFSFRRSDLGKRGSACRQNTID
jgi:hypothetical protein